MADTLTAAEMDLGEWLEGEGLATKDKMGAPMRTVWLQDTLGEVLIYETTERGIVYNYNGLEYPHDAAGLDRLMGALRLKCLTLETLWLQ